MFLFYFSGLLVLFNMYTWPCYSNCFISRVEIRHIFMYIVRSLCIMFSYFFFNSSYNVLNTPKNKYISIRNININ